MKEVFKLYDEIGGYKSLVRFLKFSELKCSKVNYNKIKKLYKKFEESILNNNDYYIRKDYNNFRKFCFEIEDIK